MTENDNTRDPEQAGTNSPAGGRGSQGTTPDNRYSRVEGQTTILPGISGASLSYLPGDIVDNAYQLTKLLGRGGMGAVFACKHIVLGKNYALKLISGEQLSGQAWSRFQMEAQSLAKLNHPGIVGIHNMGIDKEQCPYYVMDLLNGETLDALIHRSGPLDVAAALDIFIQVADALASAHLQGIIHRDVKPSNLMLLQDEQRGVTRAKLVDFGIARLPKQGVVSQSQTATGLIFGTPFYMSPEQCHGSRVDQRSDIYSLGCALFEALTGAPPFVGDNAFHTFMLQQTEEPPSIASRAPRQNFPPSLEPAVRKMLQKDPADRYQTMSQVKHDLERIKAGKSIMAAGMSNTSLPSFGAIEKAPGPPPVNSWSNRSSQAGLADVPESAAASAAGQSSLVKIIVGVGLLLVVPISAIFLWQTFNPSPKLGQTAPTKQATTAPEVIGDQDSNIESTLADLGTIAGEGNRGVSNFVYPQASLKALGASEDELHSVSVRDLAQLPKTLKLAKAKLETLEQDPQWLSTTFMKDGVFHFGDDYAFGAISIDNSAPIWTKGDIPAPPDKNACLYLFSGVQDAPEILKKFGPNDLTGVAMAFHSPDKVAQALDEIGQWKRLKDLWFFNPLIKTITEETDDWGESTLSETVLPRLEKLPGLSGLGLCYPVSGPAILNMDLLHRLDTIRLKRIKNFEPLLAKLPEFDNLKEVFLMSLETKDEELKILARMKNLQKLTVLRGHLTLASLHTFKIMKALKTLRLDRNDWTDQQKKIFQKNLPNVTVSYEKVIDRQFWPNLPDDPSKSGKK